ncbi:MAG TPA: hypothetical protein DDZ90_31830, partial [Planctomycetaceae bacterium]|nr:hypothetical protein [Planctomycetaceae bacterium]
MIALTVSTAHARGPEFNLGQGLLMSQTTALPPAVGPEPMHELAPQPYEHHVASQEIPVFDCVKYKRP